MSKIFDLPIYSGSYTEYLDKVLSTSGYSCFVNSHMLYEFNKRTGFEPALLNASFLLPDGVPLLYSLRVFGSRNTERIAGNDVTLSLVRLAETRKLKMFWIGGKKEVLDTISKKLDRQSIVHKTYSPPYLPIEAFNFEEQAAMINDFSPDVVLVGLGCPKQEIWMSKMKGKVKAPMFGVGGAFLLYAEVDSRAPKWMRDLAMEWLYRLILEPRRLFKRYLVTNAYFINLIIREIWQRKSV